MTTLEQAAETIGAVSATDGGYVEVRRTEHEVILGADRQGLLWLAAHCLHLALQGRHGSHLHLDETSTEVCEQPLVIRYWQRDNPK
jgi:hypothetical protein